MRKILIGILSIVFIGLLYLNFGMESKSQITKTLETEKEKTTLTKKQDKKQNEEKDSAPVQTETNEEVNLTFNDENLNQKYQDLKEKNEPLIISVLLPSYYSPEFIDGLSEKFNTDTVQFKRVDVTENTTNLNTLSVYENSDAAIISGLQIQDYNDEVLPEHDLRKLLEYYMNLYNNGITTYVLSDANVYAHNNLETVLLADQEYLQTNDYYFINNIDIEEETMYDSEKNILSSEVENKIQENIKKELVQ